MAFFLLFQHLPNIQKNFSFCNRIAEAYRSFLVLPQHRCLHEMIHVLLCCYCYYYKFWGP